MNVDGVDLVLLSLIIGYVATEISRHRALIRIAELSDKDEAERRKPKDETI